MAGTRERLRSLLDIRDPWILAAFYSDPQVSEITARLNSLWREAGERGEPLDYASDEDIRVLLSIAERYTRMHPSQARALAIARMGGESEDRDRDNGRSPWRGLIGGVARRLRRAS